jgi:acetylornithine deacetylase
VDSNDLTPLEKRLIASLDVEGMIAATQSLVRIPSWGGRETEAQEAVAALLEDAGLETDVWEIDLPDVQAHPQASWEIERDRALGVVGSLSGVGDGPTLILNGHVDVVPPGDHALWTHAPFDGVVENGRLYGRGALDMKGPLMAGLFAMKTVRDAGVALSGCVRLHSVIGEEDGGLGTLASILRGYRGDAAIVMEPTDLSIAPVQAGCLNFRVRVPGLAAHGAVRTEGVSAFEKAFFIYEAIQALEESRNADCAQDELFAGYEVPFPISIGIMSGGDWASSVPDHVVMEGRLGVRPGEGLEDARSNLEQAIAEAAAADRFLSDHPPKVEWWGGRFLPASTPVEHRVVRCLQSAATAVHGTTPELRGVPFGADAGLLQAVGDTAPVLFGAGDIRRAHRPDEYVEVDGLTRMARTLAVMITRYCGVDR